ncbi:META domain-containing protein [Streptomyces yunnanensis]|uniref:META domain-containing protein n=2 Tax=Streptomyces yunnanensis TaxID=156453 RepID=A0A9X8MQF5_9ACTN|nr:META domain-containing protein [Streptomyces yunnanensis]
MRSFRRVRALTVTMLAALLTFTACDVGPAGPNVTKQRLGGAGDLLVGAVLNFDGGEIDGRKFESPPPTEETTYLRNWVEFHRDGTVAGTYGCTPFRMTANVRATDLTLEEDTPTAAVEGCPQSLTSFERQLKEIFTGHLAISEQKAQEEGQNGTIELKNGRGDHITLSVTRPAQGFFGTRWKFWYVQLDDGGQGSDPDDKTVSWIFHENGTMTGKLVCDDFTAQAHFTGDVVTISSMRLTTHRKCAPGQAEHDEGWLGTPPPYTYGVFGAGTRLTVRPHTTDSHGIVETLFKRDGSR